MTSDRMQSKKFPDIEADSTCVGLDRRKRGVVANSSSKPAMKPFCLKDGSAWYIELTWPDGRVEHIDSFQSESEINDWISRKSDAWLKARHQSC
jgi:hypothetical protein